MEGPQVQTGATQWGMGRWVVLARLQFKEDSWGGACSIGLEDEHE